MLAPGALRILIEEKFGTLAYFLVYALLEWLVIILLFVDGFLAFLSYEIARLFELKTPCLLCTRLDHFLVQRSSNFYYNESICEVHKRDISTLTYCHMHMRLSDIRSMCQGCLLSSDKDFDCDRHKSVVGDERNVQLKQFKKYEMEIVANERIGILRCSCCGKPLRSKSPSRYKSLSVAVPASPGVAWFSGRNDEGGTVDVQASRYTELKLTANTGLHLHGDEDAPLVDSHGRGDMNHVIEDEPRTPHFTDRNIFFGIPLTDGATPMSPKRLDLVMEPINEGEEKDDIVARLKRQVTLDRRSLMALYMELDEERSASAVAANNAMAMITRLQEDKAAVQMEALQYQRMMEEQTEYDQEAMQMMKDMLFKREDEMKALECELEEYRAGYGIVRDVESDLCEVALDEDYQNTVNSQAVSSSDSQNVDEGGVQDELAALDYEGEMCHLLGLLRELEVKMYSTSDEIPTSLEGDEERKVVVAREVALVKERLRAVEAESVLLKDVAMSLQRERKGMKVLSEIAQHLRKHRQKHDVY